MQNINPTHPGKYIKSNVLKTRKLSVKSAAEFLKVSRSALSHLVNGNAALTTDMALRIEKAFGEDSLKLLMMQVEYDKYQMREKEREIAVPIFRRRFLELHANQIEAYFHNSIEARSILPAFLRHLVNNTAENLRLSNFPAYDNSQRHGWDGETDAGSATPWIPFGKAGWEFGTDQNPRNKAQKDYEARTQSISETVRKETTFVFVTPRNWKNKDDWIKETRQKNEWKDIRALDANDLEQWTEQSILTQGWFYEKFGLYQDDDGLASLEKCWDEWASVTTPSLNEGLFSDSINEENQERIKEWLSTAPTPFFIQGETREEALAFLATIMKKFESYHLDRAVVISSPSALKKIVGSGVSFIGVVASPEMEKDSASLVKKQHLVTICTKDKLGVDPKNLIIIKRPTYQTFRNALTSMGIHERDVDRCADETGGSLSVLRRRLSDNNITQFPEWSSNPALVRKVIPLLLAGNWNDQNQDDQEVLRALANEQKYSSVDENINEVLNLPETPMWAVGSARGFTSKIDTLHVVKELIGRKNIEDFFVIAEIVLSEEDPALELPEDKRWAAGLYGKTRNHSPELRKSLCDTLIQLSVFGQDFFEERLGINTSAKAASLVRDLLMPLRCERWLSQQNELQYYAEAAPAEFLEILEEDLQSSDPKVMALMKPVSGGIFGSQCIRVGLIWALELLAWDSARLPRVSLVLAQLAQEKIDDNWSNKPINSLLSIYRSWLPQTSANLERRIRGLEGTCERFPDVGWQLCIDQFSGGSRVGHYNARPKWRNEAEGAGDAVPKKEDKEFRRFALDMALGWKNHNFQTLSDLVKSAHSMDDQDIERVTTLIVAWHSENPESSECAKLQECIRRFSFTRRGKQNLPDGAREKFAEMYHLLTPEDVVERNQWLFEKVWVEESADEIEEANLNYTKRIERINGQRIKALNEVWEVAGVEGIKALILNGEAGGAIGEGLARGQILNSDENFSFLEALLSDSSRSNGHKLDACIAGFLKAKSAECQREIYLTLADSMGGFHELNYQVLRLIKNAPFGEQVWEILEKLPPEYEEGYWAEVSPRWTAGEIEDLAVAINKLIAVNRPRAAFSIAQYNFQDVQSLQLFNLLEKVATSSSEPNNQYPLEEYQIADAFEVLNERGDVLEEDLGRLEFMFMQAIRYSEIEIPNFSNQVFKDPRMFMQLLALAYRRNDGAEDPSELLGEINANKKSTLADAATAALDKLKPALSKGNDRIQNKRLIAWTKDARVLCKTYAREEIGDQIIGQILARCPNGVDEIWPCEAVRLTLEEVASKEMMIGMSIGLFNSRGETVRGSGGRQERELADKYREWAEQLAFDSPYTAKLLEHVAYHYEREAHWWDIEEKTRNKSGRW